MERNEEELLKEYQKDYENTMVNIVKYLQDNKVNSLVAYVSLATIIELLIKTGELKKEHADAMSEQIKQNVEKWVDSIKEMNSKMSGEPYESS